MNTAGGRVAVLGSLNVDISARVERHPAPGETLLGTGGASSPGGKGANQAVAAALIGASVLMVGAVGSDAHAQTALRGLQAAGVDTSGVVTRDGATGLALITVAASGENTIIVVPGANATLGAADLTPLQTLTPEDVLVLQGEIPVQTANQAARRSEARVVLNLAPVVELDTDVLRLADPLVVNEHEAQGALAILGSRSAGSHEDVARALVAAGVPSVVMTLGGEGALVATDTLRTIPPLTVNVIDTTGAGDAFVGALAAGLVEGLSLEQSAERANQYAAAAVTSVGAQDSYPDWRGR